MGFGDKCCVGGCDNERRYPEKWLIHSHVGRLSFHKPNNQMIEAWSRQVQKGRKDFAIGKSRESVVVFSNTTTTFIYTRKKIKDKVIN